MKRKKLVEEYIEDHQAWEQALIKLRDILLGTKLEETIKWGAPVYTFNKKNIIGLAAFKNYTALWFFQGALLKDKHKKLVNAQEGQTLALRQWRFYQSEEIDNQEDIILKYVNEALKNQEKNERIKPKKNKPLILPDELKQLLEKEETLRRNFEQFSLTDRRDFADHISEAKRPQTKQNRLGKIAQMILRGEGLNDKYKKTS